MNLANIKHLNLHNKSLIKLFLRNKLIWQKMSRVLKEWRGFSPLTCTPTVAGNFEDIKIYGNSVQNTELFSYDLWQDGFINSSGSADPVTSSSYPDAKYFKITLKQGQVVQFTVEPNNASGRVRYIDPTTNTVIGTVSGSGNNQGYAISTAQESSGFISATLTALKDVTLAFLDIRGTIDAYTNFSLIANVSPSNPVEVESVGDKTPNIVDIYDDAVKSKDELTGERYGMTWSKNKDGSVTLNGTTTASIDIYFEGTNSYTVRNYQVNRPAGDYTMRKLSDTCTGEISSVSGFNMYCVWYNSSGTSLVGTRSVTLAQTTNTTFTPSETVTYSRTFIRIPSGVTCTNFTIYPMIVEGNVVGDFEPYGYKIPVKVNGKNKLKLIQGINIDSTTGKEKTSATTYSSDYIPAKDLFETNNLCFSTNVNGLYNFIWAYNKNKEAIKRTGGGVILTRKFNSPSNFSSGTGSGTADTEIEYIRVCFYPNAGATGDINFNTGGWAQLEDGTEVTDYEPYIEPTVTNVFLDEQLRKVDVHADYIDFKSNKLVREIKELTFTGYEDWFTSSSAGNHYYSIPKSALGTDLPHGSDDILCSHFKVYAGDVSALPVGQVCVGNNNVNFNFDGTNEDIAGFETWLSQNNVKLYYPLTTPTEETYTIDNPIMALDNTSIIAVDTTIPPSEIYASEYVDG